MAEWIAGRIDCDEQCEIPAGTELFETPPSRHDWSDVVRCPNDGCERTFLTRSAPVVVEPVAVKEASDG